MMFSVNAPSTMARRAELTRFVLNREIRSLPPQYRFFAYYNIEGQPRTTPIIKVWAQATVSTSRFGLAVPGMSQ